MQKLQALAVDPQLFGPQHSIAFQGGEPVSWQQFMLRVAQWQHGFESVEASRVALFHSNTVEFAAALLALWRLRKIPVLPATSSVDETLQGLCAAFAGEFNRPDNILPKTDAPSAPEHLATEMAGEQDTALIIFTSGSSGAPVAIEKVFAQLTAELKTWELLYGYKLASALFTGTVSHQHIYGLLFRLLWPLSSGRPMVDRAREYWEDLFADVRMQRPLLIVSSPAHLDRLPPEEVASEQWQQLAGACVELFSSGAPLAQQSARQAAKRFEREVTEVYGSSETGGVARRQQTQSDVWQCLPEVNMQVVDGLLQLRGPHLPKAFDRPGNNWFSSADRAQCVSDNQFKLLGRSDRLVKLAGKRISLTAIENAIAEHKWVSECRALSLPDKKDRMAVVVVLNGDGNHFLVDQGRGKLNQLLLQQLDHQEAIARPRYWRYVSALPRDTQGKVTQAQLQRLFAEQARKFAELIESEQRGDKLVIKLFIPTDLFYFRGHFPGTPILPGVVQTHWAIHYASEHFNIDAAFSHLEAIKFQQVIRPHDVVTLELSYQAEKQKLSFSYRGQHAKHSSGRVVFHVEPKHDSGVGNDEHAEGECS